MTGRISFCPWRRRWRRQLRERSESAQPYSSRVLGLGFGAGVCRALGFNGLYCRDLRIGFRLLGSQKLPSPAALSRRRHAVCVYVA